MNYLIACILTAGLAFAQLSPEASQSLQQAQSIAAQAEQEYAGFPFNPDQYLWKEALRMGELARSYAPNDITVIAFLAQTYSKVNWYVKAWDYWLQFVSLGGTLEGDNLLFFSYVGNELGFAWYRNGQLSTALGYYQDVNRFNPGDLETVRWLGRIHLELGQAAQALPYWQTLVNANPNDEGVQYFFQLSQQQVSYGASASQAFNRGMEAYEAGDIRSAASLFAEAADSASSFLQAQAWAARSASETGQAEQALRYWARVIELDPDFEGAAYNLERAKHQLDYGVNASNTFYQGIEHYQAQRFSQAYQSFVASTQANPNFLEAHVWAARSAMDARRPEEAIPFWNSVLRLDPADGRAKYFLKLAEAQTRYGVEAALSFDRGISLYNEGQLQAAAQAFEQAVALNPRYIDAVVWAARSFQELEQVERAEPYWQRVLELNPDDARARYFLGLVEEQVAHGFDAATYFDQGVSSYNLAQFELAKESFIKATQSNPNYAEAWGWLGRVYFEQASYGLAADAYTRAMELNPEEPAYRFFAGEAKKLADRP